MTKALQVKLLAAILAVLGVIATVIVRSERPAFVMSKQDRELQKKFEQKSMPGSKPY